MKWCQHPLHPHTPFQRMRKKKEKEKGPFNWRSIKFIIFPWRFSHEVCKMVAPFKPDAINSVQNSLHLEGDEYKKISMNSNNNIESRRDEENSIVAEL